MSLSRHYLENVRFEFERYKTMGEKTFKQLSPQELHWRPSENDNSIAIIAKHLAGNMLSRWTNFLTEDGEKPWRHRDTEFEDPPNTKEELMLVWEKGWQCLFQAIEAVNESNFDANIKIRGKKHSIVQAFNRQLAHYASHVGQIVMLGKMIKGSAWTSLSIPKGQSEAFNKNLFGKTSS
ncbi:DUF1572 family protein [Allomuricauda sp. SCSIO 65647]|uniref:DUF1572 family protein n=1 Tax=Allomuricauda sp. SCSIO 65647 TaxID=2908843 RepID=UPI001F398865|nr:DUF1572 family protein [Muricauda sp. SCSIO 65647]UJH66907.1 DUF1572 domain-containing protein [Muricauda sp. SCSIO 65647]